MNIKGNVEWIQGGGERKHEFWAHFREQLRDSEDIFWIFF